MTRILAIDTTADVCSLALYDESDLFTFHESLPRQHARQVLPRLEVLFAQSGWARTSLDYVVYGRGPGSFTGIRIAAGVAQGIALGCGCGVVPISTLQTLAYECETPDNQEIWTALDARMQELYFARYRKEASGVPELIGTEQLLAPGQLPPPEMGILLTGNGWLTEYDFSAEWGPVREKAHGRQILPNAAYAARLASQLVQRDESLILPPEQALPVYLRDKVTWDNKPKVGS